MFRPIDLSTTKDKAEEVNTAFSREKKGRYTGFLNILGKEKASRRMIWLLVCLSVFAALDIAQAAMSINLVAVNASADQTRQLPITYYLPKELKADDIIDTSGLDIDYDIDKTCYFVHGTITMAPKESRTIKIQVRDVWYITQEDVDLLKSQLDENLARSEGTENFEAGKALREKLVKQLDYVLAQQSSFSGNVERRIEEYRAHTDVLNEIRNTTFSIEYWEDKNIKMPEAQSKTVTFVIEVENPRKDVAKKLKQQHYLPEEVKSEHIVDALGFDVRFDEGKNQAYLFKEEEFQPAEKKRYEITIQDIWRVPQDKLDNLDGRTQTAYKELEKSEYANSAKYLFDTITTSLGRIQTSQDQKKNMKEHIGVYRGNKVAYQETEEDVQKLERILALVRAKRLEELERSRVKNVLRQLRSLDGVAKVSEAVFGQKLSVNRTWKLIWGTLIFVGVFTAIHFLTWLRRSRDARRKEAAERIQSA